ncbi:hypothetical protein TREES_T100014252 [Tupaia chinensis]|uniref:Uncharacterized protein n=1 Tax=Tupaia chinensis TaxID=246437 RepID=L9JF12_TUPCH|nr:hypothetical protein TREES_T100014252 [Tupaia chinensis]
MSRQTETKRPSVCTSKEVLPSKCAVRALCCALCASLRLPSLPSSKAKADTWADQWQPRSQHALGPRRHTRAPVRAGVYTGPFLYENPREHCSALTEEQVGSLGVQHIHVRAVQKRLSGRTVGGPTEAGVRRACAQRGACPLGSFWLWIGHLGPWACVSMVTVKLLEPSTAHLHCICWSRGPHPYPFHPGRGPGHLVPWQTPANRVQLMAESDWRIYAPAPSAIYTWDRSPREVPWSAQATS